MSDTSWLMGATMGSMADIAARAQQLLDLHHTGTTLVLPTVWDAWSARAVVGAGFRALTIGSHPLADSRGQADNEAMTLDDALDGIRRVTGAVDVPVSADMESGYDTEPAELVDRVLDAGAVGINVEDSVHSAKRMRSADEHADYIGALRAAADQAGVALVINARTDAFLGKYEQFDDPLTEAIRRLRLCEAAGARCLYPVKAPDAAAVAGRRLLDRARGIGGQVVIYGHSAGCHHFHDGTKRHRMAVVRGADARLRMRQDDRVRASSRAGQLDFPHAVFLDARQPYPAPLRDGACLGDDRDFHHARSLARRTNPLWFHNALEVAVIRSPAGTLSVAAVDAEN